MSIFASISDYQREASKKLEAYEYFAHGATNLENTTEKPAQALKRWNIKYRILCDKTNVDSRTKFLGHPISAPIGISPTAFHGVVDPEAECATARGACRVGLPYVQSFSASNSPEEIAEAAPSGIHLLQFYPLTDRNYLFQCFKRAETSGYKGLVLTGDFSTFNLQNNLWKYSDASCLSNAKQLFNTFRIDETGKIEPLFDDSATFEFVKWVKSVTNLPLIIKGLLNGKDAELAIEAGVDAIWVSNHGGRQMDSMISTIDALPEVVKIVKKRCPVYVDGGFRSGSDIFKALALGADMVFLGQPIIWALACEGSKGVENLLNLLKNELNAALAHTGTCVGNISRDLVVRRYSSQL